MFNNLFKNAASNEVTNLKQKVAGERGSKHDLSSPNT